MAELNEIYEAQRERASIPTPALIIDVPVLERNIAAMADFAARSGVHLRPHAKSHKCIEIARRQMAAGAVGISCATLGEIAAMMSGQVSGLLLTSPIAGEAKLRELGRLLRLDPSIMVVADDPAGIAELAALATEVGTRLQVLIDVDVGQARTGCRTACAIVDLAERIKASPSLELCGVQAYAGHIQHIVRREARLAAARTVAEKIRAVCAALRQAGCEPSVVTGAGTGTAEIDATLGVYTELQCGSYVFMDVDYLRIEGIEAGYRPSLFVDTTVVSTQWDSHVTTDAGTKSFALNGPPPIPATGERDWIYSYDGDEFGKITLGPGSRRPLRGERIALVVSHCDPTVVLYRQYFCTRADRVVESWRIV
jgi:D-serine deaminase-like pyridoxal phosphate-dependent protein